MTTAIFIDLDGTLITTKSGNTYPKNSYDWIFIPETIEALKNYLSKRKVDHLIIVSNQGGIEKGYVNEHGFKRKIKEISEVLAGKLDIDVYYQYCKDMVSYFRKPNPGMAYKAALLMELDLSKCIMIGDASGFKHSFSDSDRKFAENSGIKTYYDIKEFQNDFISAHKS